MTSPNSNLGSRQCLLFLLDTSLRGRDLLTHCGVPRFMPPVTRVWRVATGCVSAAACAVNVLSRTGVAGIADFLKTSLLFMASQLQKESVKNSSIPLFHRSTVSSPLVNQAEVESMHLASQFTTFRVNFPHVVVVTGPRWGFGREGHECGSSCTLLCFGKCFVTAPSNTAFLPLSITCELSVSVKTPLSVCILTSSSSGPSSPSSCSWQHS